MMARQAILARLTATLAANNTGSELDLDKQQPVSFAEFGSNQTPDDVAFLVAMFGSACRLFRRAENSGAFAMPERTTSVSTSSGGVAFPIDIW